MSLEISQRKYFTLPHASSNTFLLGNSGQRIIDEIELEFDFSFKSTSSDTIQVNDLFSFKLLGGDWSDKGFVIGDQVDLSGFLIDNNGAQIDVSQNNPYTITDIVDDVIEFDQLIATNSFQGLTSPQQGGSTSITITNISRSAPQDVEVFHNLLPNSNNHTDASIIDGEVNRFLIEGVDAMTVGDTLSPIQMGNKSGGAYFSNILEFERLSDSAAGNTRYSLKLSYMMPDIEDESFDKPSWFESEQCLKSTYRVVGTPETNNPNSTIETTYSATLGNTGWYNEEHNQGENDFTLDSVTIVDSNGDPLSALDHNQTCTITAVVKGSANFNPIVEGKLSIIPPVSDWKNNQFSHGANTYTAHFLKPGGGGAIRNNFQKNGGAITTDNESVDTGTANQITIEFDFVPNAAFTSYIESLTPAQRLHRVSVSVESTGGDANDNNNVSIPIIEGLFEAAPIPDQPFDGVKDQGFYNHAQDITTGTSSVNYNGRTEDDMVFKALFDLEENEEWERINLSVEVVNTNDGTSFDLFSRNFNIDGNPNAPMVGGVIQFNFEEQLSQFLDADDRNVISIQNTGNTGTGTYEVELIWSMMANWRYWLPNSSAFQAFFDNTLPNNGKNQEWVRYLELSGYTLRARVRLIKDSVAYYFGGNVNILDYDDWAGTTTHSFFDTSGNPITALIQGQDVLYRADHVLDSGSWDINDLWGYLAFRPLEADPRKQISTVWDWTSQNNPLKPKSGETKATLEIVTTNTTDDTARVECLIDGSLVTNVDNTPVSRIQSPAAPSCQHPIDYVFDYIEANKVNDSDIVTLYNQLLNRVDATETNVCCPTCDKLYNGGVVFGNTTVYAIGSKSDIDAVVATSVADPDEVCCYDAYKETSSFTSCDSKFDSNINSINGVITGDISYIDNTLIPAQMNSYTGVTELEKLKDRLEALTTDQTIRYDLYREIIERGLSMRCKADGTKFLSRL